MLLDYLCIVVCRTWQFGPESINFYSFFIQGGVKVAWHDLISSFFFAPLCTEKGNRVRAMYIISEYLLVLKWISSFAPLGVCYKGCWLCSNIQYRVLLSVLGKRDSWQNWLRACGKNTDNGFVMTTILIRALKKIRITLMDWRAWFWFV
jgi:hypothetical protein